MSEHWSNWSGSVRCAPQAIATPQRDSELLACIRDAQYRTVRAAGSGHSFVPLCASDDLLISLDGLHGIVSADAQARQATIRAGTKIHLLGEPLLACGLALENQGDIDRQSLA